MWLMKKMANRRISRPNGSFILVNISTFHAAHSDRTYNRFRSVQISLMAACSLGAINADELSSHQYAGIEFPYLIYK